MKPNKFGILIRGLDALMWRRFRAVCDLNGISATGRLRELIAEDVIAREVLIEAAKTARREARHDWS